MLGISERRIRLYIEMKRLPAVRAADVLMIPLENVANFKRKIVGRPRKNAPVWRISSIDDFQFITSIFVQMRPHRDKELQQILEAIKRDKRHTFPGTVARYIVKSETIPDQIEILLVWRSAVMPDQVERERDLEALRQILADVLDWDTAQYNQGQVLMHT